MSWSPEACSYAHFLNRNFQQLLDGYSRTVELKNYLFQSPSLVVSFHIFLTVAHIFNILLFTPLVTVYRFNHKNAFRFQVIN